LRIDAARRKRTSNGTISGGRDRVRYGLRLLTIPA